MAPRYNAAASFPVRRSPMRLPATLILALALSGCGSIVHRIDIQQGNAVAPETFARLKEGMTRPEVRTLLGTPLLTDVFHANRWDYYYRNEKGGRFIEQNRFSVHFANDKVARIEGGPTPSAARPAAIPVAPAAPAPAGPAASPPPK